MPLRHLTKISDLSKEEFLGLLRLGINVKANPQDYRQHLKDLTLLMLFAKPSLRTRVSFEVGMTQMGGHGIFYSMGDSPLGKKESIVDFAKVISRMCDICMARVASRKEITDLAANASIPIINALDDYAHPCQMLADMMTILENKDSFDGLKMAYCGDVKNNVTYDLMRSAAVLGFQISVAGPKGPNFEIEESVLEECEKLCKISGGKVIVAETAEEAVKDVDVIYTDSWMSYGIPEAEKAMRVKEFMPYQVNQKILSLAKKDCIFMNCLPAMRGLEQTAEVIDGPNSVVYDEAENRLHAQKALMLWQLGKSEIEL